jgi:hypothetical protein
MTTGEAKIYFLKKLGKNDSEEVTIELIWINWRNKRQMWEDPSSKQRDPQVQKFLAENELSVIRKKEYWMERGGETRQYWETQDMLRSLDFVPR